MIQTLSDYITQLAELKRNFGTDDFFFRGQGSEEWKISSSAYRRLDKNKLPLTSQTMFSYISSLLIETRKRDFTNSLTDLDLIAEIQHRGGATTFIDFSKDAFIALYMACSSSSNSDNPIVYCIQKDIAELSNLTKSSNYANWFDNTSDSHNFYYFPALVNNRIIKQSGLFVFNKLGLINKDTITEKIIIDSKFKNLIVEELKEYANLTEETVYPDLQGFLNANNQFSPLKLTSEYFQEALEEFENESYYNAIKKFQKCIDNKINDTICLKKIGICFSKLYNNKEAIEYLDLYISKISNDPEGYYYLGLQYYSNLDTSSQELSKHYVLNSITDKSFDKARENLEKAIELSGTNAKYYITLADLYFNEGMYWKQYGIETKLGLFDKAKIEKAKEYYSKANDLTQTRKGKIHSQLGIISLILTKKEDISNYQEAIKWDNLSKVTGFANLGAYYFDLYRESKNEKHLNYGIYFCNQAIFFDKFHFNAYNNVIGTLLYADKFGFAKKLLLKYIESIPDSSSLIILLSTVLEHEEKKNNQRKYTDLNSTFEKISKKYLPTNEFVDSVWADFLLNENKLELAYDKLFATHLEKDNYLLRIILSKYHFLKSEIDFAMVNLEIASGQITKEEFRYCINVYLRKVPTISKIFSDNNLEEKIESWIK